MKFFSIPSSENLSKNNKTYHKKFIIYLKMNYTHCIENKKCFHRESLPIPNNNENISCSGVQNYINTRNHHFVPNLDLINSSIYSSGPQFNNNFEICLNEEDMDTEDCMSYVGLNGDSTIGYPNSYIFENSLIIEELQNKTSIEKQKFDKQIKIVDPILANQKLIDTCILENLMELINAEFFPKYLDEFNLSYLEFLNLQRKAILRYHAETKDKEILIKLKDIEQKIKEWTEKQKSNVLNSNLSLIKSGTTSESKSTQEVSPKLDKNKVNIDSISKCQEFKDACLKILHSSPQKTFNYKPL